MIIILQLMENIAYHVALTKVSNYGIPTEEHCSKHIPDMAMKFWMLRVLATAGFVFLLQVLIKIFTLSCCLVT